MRKTGIQKFFAVLMAMSLTAGIAGIGASANEDDCWKYEKRAIETILSMTEDDETLLGQWISAIGTSSNGKINSVDANEKSNVEPQSDEGTENDLANETAAQNLENSESSPAADASQGESAQAGTVQEDVAQETVENGGDQKSIDQNGTAPKSEELAENTEDPAGSTETPQVLENTLVLQDSASPSRGEVAEEINEAVKSDVPDGQTAIWRIYKSNSTKKLNVFFGFLNEDQTAADVLMYENVKGTVSWKCGTAAVADGMLKVSGEDQIYSGKVFTDSAEQADFISCLKLYAGESTEAEQISYANPSSHTMTLPVADKGSVYTVTGLANGDNQIVITDSVTLYLTDAVLEALNDGLAAIKLLPRVTASVIVSGTCSLTGGLGCAGIEVPASATLNLSGTGILTAVGSNGTDSAAGGAGIGGDSACPDSGRININGADTNGNAAMVLTAAGFGAQAAGIGSCCKYGVQYPISIQNVASLTAQGGYVESGLSENGKEGGAGIGGGGKCQLKAGSAEFLADETRGAVTIANTHVLSAIGGGKSAGIGASYWRSCDVIIENSTIDLAQGGNTGAGIGMSRMSNENNTENYKNTGRVLITDSTVTAQGGFEAAGIGNGPDYKNINTTIPESDEGIVLIQLSGSTVNAIGGAGGAGIGGGYKQTNFDVTISSGKVYAQGGVFSKTGSSDEYSKDIMVGGSAGIGGGCDGSLTGYTTGCYNGSTYDASGYRKAGTIAIASGADVRAVSNGGKWAIDLNCNVSGVENTVQALFTVSSLTVTGKDKRSDGDFKPDYEKLAGDSCTLLEDLPTRDVTLAGRSISIPDGYGYTEGGYLCIAATANGSTNATVNVTTADGETQTQLFGHYGSAASADRAAEYAAAVDAGTKASTVFSAASSLEASSYTYTALRGDVLETSQIENDNGGDDDDSSTSNSPAVVIPSTDVPMTDLPEENVPMADLPEENVPMAELPEATAPAAQNTLMAVVPKTGDSSLALLSAVTAAGSLAGLVYVLLSAKKREHNI